MSVRVRVWQAARLMGGGRRAIGPFTRCALASCGSACDSHAWTAWQWLERLADMVLTCDGPLRPPGMCQTDPRRSTCLAQRIRIMGRLEPRM